jgi:hypothetical protein
MRGIFLLVGALCVAALLAACGDFANTVNRDIFVPMPTGPNPNNLPDPNYVPKPGMAHDQGYDVALSPVVMDELFTDADGIAHAWLELFNTTATPVDIGGWTLTDGFSSYTMPYGTTVDAGARMLVHFGAAGTDSAAERFAPAFGTVNPRRGSLALMRYGTELVHFVQWGEAGNPLEDAAAAAGAWIAGDFTPAAPVDRSLQYDGSANDSSAWHIGAPTPGQ